MCFFKGKYREKLSYSKLGQNRVYFMFWWKLTNLDYFKNFELLRFLCPRGFITGNNVERNEVLVWQ